MSINNPEHPFNPKHPNYSENIKSLGSVKKLIETHKLESDKNNKKISQ